MFPVSRHLALAIFVLSACYLPQAAEARAALCDAAAQQAARSSGVPLPVMRAITRVETGRDHGQGLDPWPWTVNMQGQGHWFATRGEAEQFVAHALARGVRNLDIGCFQINHRWHGAAFRSPSEMFDPLRNAAYAARFLKNLHDQSGDWSVAAGWFHSRTPALARKYRARFEQVRKTLSEPDRVDPVFPSRTEGVPRAAANTFPLMTGATASGAHNSLVPLARGAPAPLVPGLGAMRGS